MMDNNEEIMVSICCATYNHENYIADAIEGFLMQETDFKYEILVHDDASTDKTADIIRYYAEIYPEIIKPIYQTVNQYSKGIQVTATFNYPRAKGRYIALCEGDDYWTDPKKLQIQFECLENNPEAVCCYHSDYILDEKGLRKESRLKPQNQRDYTKSEMMAGYIILPLTSFFRNLDILRNYPIEAKYVKNGDRFLFSIIGQYGSGMYLPMIEPSVYRVHDGGIWSMKHEKERRAMHINTWYWLGEYYARIGNSNFEEKFKRKCISELTLGFTKIEIILIFVRLLLPNRLYSLVKKSRDKI